MEESMVSLYDTDRGYREKFGHIIGVDEAGRGPLAGPVTAAAVCFAPDRRSELIRDSKKLTPKQRDRAYRWILENAEGWAVHSAGVQTINKMNILGASLYAMERAVEKLQITGAHVMVDGDRVPGNLQGRCHAVTGGDGISFSIAAASILAKVTRDRIMLRWAEIYPDYGFDRHKGYGTAVHLNAIAAYLPTPLHRRDFAPVKNMDPRHCPDTRTLGKWGENWAVYYLILKGYRFVARNYYGGRKGEIDIIMKDGGLYLMVEVKTVFGKEEYAAAERVDGKKIQKMIHAAERYFYDLNISEYNVRFDAVTVSGTDLNKPHIEHYKNII